MFGEIYDYGKSLGIPSVGFREIQSPVILSFTDQAFQGWRQHEGALTLPWVGRTSGIAPRLFADSADYLIGDGNRATAHRQLINTTPYAWLADWLDARPELPGEPDAVYTFEVDGVLIAQSEDMQQVWLDCLFSRADRIYCTVLGEMAPRTSYAGAKIKGLPGGHKAGASLFVASDRFGGTPVSTEAAEVIATTINQMLRDKQRVLSIGTIRYLFWSVPDQPEVWRSLLEPAENLTEQWQDGKFYAIALKAVDQGNVAIVDQFTVSVSGLIENLDRWEQDSACPTPNGNVPGCLTPAWAYALALGNCSTQEAIALMHSICLAQSLPAALMAKLNLALRRQGPDYQQSQLITAGLTRQQRWKDRTGFERRDYRKGYRAGYNARKRGRDSLPDDLPESDWGAGYRQGFEAAIARD